MRPSTVRPSTVLHYIRGAFPEITSSKPFTGKSAGDVQGLIDLIDYTDPRLLNETFGREEWVLWVRALAALRSTVACWTSIEPSRYLLDIGNKSPITILAELLALCPDEPTPKDKPRLMFIEHPGLRESIAWDMEALSRLLFDGEWKAATVIGGSVIEALLLDALLRREVEARAVSGKKSNLDEWHLDTLIAVAVKLRTIDVHEERACLLALDYRNLIHPGRGIRTLAPVSGGTARAVGAAVDLLVDRLGRKDAPPA